MQTLSMHDRFWAKVDKSGACWTWTAGTTSRGYGAFHPRKGVTVLAHRFSYEEARGPIQDGKLLDHQCHNVLCVRPDHLRPVTNKQNMENLIGARAGNRSGVRGVTLTENGKWSAEVCHNYKRHKLGRFVTLEEAEAAVTAKRNELFTHNDADRRVA